MYLNIVHENIGHTRVTLPDLSNQSKGHKFYNLADSFLSRAWFVVNQTKVAAEKCSFFYYLAYFCYYLYVSLYFLVLFISLTILF